MKKEFAPSSTLASLAMDITDALKLRDRGRAEWVEGSVQLATRLAAVKKELNNSNKALNQWLKKNNLHSQINANDRAVLIEFGQDPAAARAIFEQTTRTSYQHIGRESRSGHVTNMETETGKPKKVRKNEGKKKPAGIGVSASLAKAESAEIIELLPRSDFQTMKVTRTVEQAEGLIEQSGISEATLDPSTRLGPRSSFGVRNGSLRSRWTHARGRSALRSWSSIP